VGLAQRGLPLAAFVFADSGSLAADKPDLPLGIQRAAGGRLHRIHMGRQLGRHGICVRNGVHSAGDLAILGSRQIRKSECGVVSRRS